MDVLQFCTKVSHLLWRLIESFGDQYFFFCYFCPRLNRFFGLIYFFCTTTNTVCCWWKCLKFSIHLTAAAAIVVPSLRVQVIASDYFSACLNVTLYFLLCSIFFFFPNFTICNCLFLSLACSLKGPSPEKRKKLQVCMRILCPLNTVNWLPQDKCQLPMLFGFWKLLLEKKFKFCVVFIIKLHPTTLVIRLENPKNI